jgi:hypothetical protein
MSYPDIFSRPWFRCLVSVGHRLHLRMEELFVRTDEHQGRSWSDVVRQIENRCLSAKDSGWRSDPDYMTKDAVKQIELFAAGFSEEAPELGEILGTIAGEIRPLADNEMLAAFEELNPKAFLMASDCATEWGGKHAVLRASKLKLAPLSIDSPTPQNEVAPLFTWTDGQTIHVLCGTGERPLFHFLCLDFYLLHEYLSHHLPVWEDTAGVLSEGYLFPLARWWHTKKSEFPISTSLVDTDWQHHFSEQKNKQSAQYWREFHSWIDWMESRCPKPRLPWVLLEMATFAEDTDHRLTEGFLGVLATAPKNPAMAFVWDILNSPSTDIQEIYQEIRKNLPSALSSNVKKRLGL